MKEFTFQTSFMAAVMSSSMGEEGKATTMDSMCWTPSSSMAEEGGRKYNYVECLHDIKLHNIACDSHLNVFRYPTTLLDAEFHL